MASRRLADAARMGLAFGASYAARRVDAAPRPFSVAFAVTNRCNLRCSYCNFPFLEQRELSFDEIARLFDVLRELGVVRLGLVGGEPLVRKDIERIVALARARGFFVSLNSNLTLYARFPEVFDDVDVVFTSLDGDAAAHVANRGEGSLDGVLDAIRELRRRRKNVVAICVVNEQTIEQAQAVLETAESLDIRVHFQAQCVDTAIVRGRLSRDVKNARMRSFFVELLAAKRHGRPVASTTAYLEHLSVWEDFFVSSHSTPGARCAAGRGFLFVDPAGDAYPCAYTKGKTPPVNLLREDWRKDWSGETPCNRCSVGPMVEFNALFEHPILSAVDAAWSYLGR